MAGFYGADVEQLKLLGRELNQQAEQLESITSRLTSRIASVAWHGPDAQRFQSEWRDRLVVSMRGTAGALRDASGRVDANALQQEDASGGIGERSGLEEIRAVGIPEKAGRDYFPGDRGIDVVPQEEASGGALPFLDERLLARPTVEPPIPGPRPVIEFERKVGE